MSNSICTVLSNLTVGSAQEAGSLTIYGLRQAESQPLVYRTLDEALASGTLEVAEVSESGSVPTLKVINRDPHRVFLMAGEQLVGAKQNRVLNTSLLLEQGEFPVPVSCVERGRWHYQNHAAPGTPATDAPMNFGSVGSASHGKLRAMMTRQVTENYAATAMPRSDQGTVWGEVTRKLSAMGSVSRSDALEQTYADNRAKLDALIGTLTAPEGCTGIAVAVNGRLVGVDVFDQAATLDKLWPKLLKAYGLDALEEPTRTAPAPTAEAIATWLRTAGSLEPKAFKSPGLGEDVRLASAAISGAGLVVEQRPVHLQLFAENQPLGA